MDRQKITLNLLLGFLGLLGLCATLGFLWGSPEFLLEIEDVTQQPDVSGAGTGVLCVLYFMYLLAITAIVWEKT